MDYDDKDKLLDSLGIDIRHLEALPPPDQMIGGGVFQNFWGERFIYQPTPWGPLREDVKGALAGAKSIAELEAFDWPSPNCLHRSQLSEQCQRHETRALLYGFADVWQRPALVRGWDNMFLDMIERPDWVHFLYLVISDLGSQHRPLISIAMFRQFIAPYLKEMCDCIHNLGGKALFHSCGMVRPFITDLIELGVDVLDPIQPTGPDMKPESLKRDFGSRMCFHGGMDMQNLLPHATPDQVEAEAHRYCEVLGACGGYILGPAHLFQPDVPPENILAVYRERKIQC
jgi:uroporphyrinogen decarboxylase